MQWLSGFLAALMAVVSADVSFATNITLDFTSGGNASLGPSGSYGSWRTYGVDLGGGVTADLAIMASGGNIHNDADEGLGVTGPPPAPASFVTHLGADAGRVETLTISLSNISGPLDQFKFTSIQTGTSASLFSDEINLNAGETLAVSTSESDFFSVAGSNTSLVHSLAPMPIVPAGGAYTFMLSYNPNVTVNSIRISKIEGELVPEPGSLLAMGSLGMVGLLVRTRRRRKRAS